MSYHTYEYDYSYVMTFNTDDVLCQETRSAARTQ